MGKLKREVIRGRDGRARPRQADPRGVAVRIRVQGSSPTGADISASPIAQTSLVSLPGLTGNPVLTVGVYWIARSSRAMTAYCGCQP
jgi:hypothetical protein